MTDMLVLIQEAQNTRQDKYQKSTLGISYSNSRKTKSKKKP
jgi:hypothetical protein